MTEENTNSVQDTPEAGEENLELEETLAGAKEDDASDDSLNTDGSEEDGSDESDGEDDDSSKGDDEVPENYEITVPEGMTLDTEMLEILTPVFKELELSNDDTQKLVDAYLPFVQKSSEEQEKAALESFKETVDGWKKDTLKELGPDSDKKLAIVAKARNQFGDDAFRTMVNETGVGNHPAFVRFLLNVGQKISEDTFEGGSNDPKPDPLKVMYPTMNKK